MLIRNATSEQILAHCEIVSMNLCKYWIGISSFLHYPIDGILLPSREQNPYMEASPAKVNREVRIDNSSTKTKIRTQSKEGYNLSSSYFSHHNADYTADEITHESFEYVRWR